MNQWNQKASFQVKCTEKLFNNVNKCMISYQSLPLSTIQLHIPSYLLILYSNISIPDPIFSRPQCKRKIAVWLRETKSRVGHLKEMLLPSNKSSKEQKTETL